MATAKDPKCREYKNSVGTSKDLWLLIVEEIIEHGKKMDTVDVSQGIITIVANKYRVLCMTSSKL